MSARHGDRLRSLFRRHDRNGESRLPAAPAAMAHEVQTVAVQGQGADGSPLVRDAAGVRPATGGEMYEHRAEFRAMGFTFGGGWDTPAAREEAAAIFGPDAHGVATEDTLAAIRLKAAEQAREAAESLRLAEVEERDRTTSDLRPARPYTERPPSDDPTLVFRSALWMPPVSGAESASVIARLTYPGPDATRERWAAWSRQMSAYTNTRSARDSASGWPPVFRTGGPDAPLRVWDLRPAVLALPAGSEAA